MISHKLENPSPGIFNVLAEKMSNENARKSIVSTLSAWKLDLRLSRRTVEERDARIHEISNPVRGKHT